MIRNRRGIFSRILIEWHGFLLNSESRGGQQWRVPNFVPSSLKWTPGQTVDGHAEFARLSELQVLLEA